jgi:hypothetical protein
MGDSLQKGAKANTAQSNVKDRASTSSNRGNHGEEAGDEEADDGR